MAEYIGTRTIKVICDDTSGFEIAARDLLDLLENAIRDAPAEVRETVTLTMDVTTSWEVGVASLMVTRNETAAEANEREAREKAETAKRMEEYAQRQFAEYQLLKAKFG